VKGARGEVLIPFATHICVEIDVTARRIATVSSKITGKVAEVLIEELQGTPARHARAGVLELDRNGLELETATIDQHCGDLPDVLRSAVTRLTRVAENDPAQRLIAGRALFHLYRSAKRKAS